jgi:hypothetical protein
MTGPVARRILEARWRVERQMWGARAEVIRAQLRVMRGTYA